MRHETLFPNAAIVARREYTELVRSRLFVLSTGFLVLLAIVVALLPLAIRLAERGAVTRVAVAASDDQLQQTSIRIIDAILNSGFANSPSTAPYRLSAVPDATSAERDVEAGSLDALVVADRQPSGGIAFRLASGEALSTDRATQLQVAMFGIAVLDWTDQHGGGGGFVAPSFDIQAAAGPTAGGAPIPAIEFAGRRIVGAVFAVLIFLSIIIYGMWVAAGVVAEKSGRVMELLISAAATKQLVVGKILGIGLAGLTQIVLVLAPAVLVLLSQDRLAAWLLGPSVGIPLSLSGLSPGLLLAFLVFFALGFTLYAAIYAAAGSLLSRPEDLQIIALPLSLLGMAGFFMSLLSLLSGTAGFIRLASFVPFWSPFVMLTRLTVGRVEAWELAASLAILLVTVPVFVILAIRIYRAGTLLYGQRPSWRTFIAAVRAAG
jgi:ABC-2 type transport system permease protein